MKKTRPIRLPNRRRFLKSAIAGGLIALGMPTYAQEIEPEHLEIVRRDVHIAGWPKSATGLKIGQLSDLHCQNIRAVERTKRAAQMLAAEKPDLVALTGDFVSGYQADDWTDDCAEALGSLRETPRGVYAVLGNHDWVSHCVHVADALAQAGFHVLQNRSLPVPGCEDLWLVGMNPRSFAAQDPIRALQDVPNNAARILLMHEPDYADEAPLGFLLQLSGHSHAGQIRVPGLPPLHCPAFGQRYPEGLQQAEHHLVYTTRGIGMMGPQMRFCCPPEITVLTLYPK